MIRLNQTLIICILLSLLTLQKVSGQDRAAWMRDAKWGIMVHYLADWRARADKMKMDVTEWNKLVNNFDVEGLADQVKSTGAGYLIFTIGQNSGYYVAPNTTYDSIVGIKPSKLSTRDLISDIADAMAKRGLKLIVYLPSGGPGSDSVARKALDYHRGADPNKEFQKKWEKVIRTWSLRWGTKISGWWFDGCYWPNIMYRSEKAPNFASFAAAARAGNPNNAVGFNPGVVYRTLSMTPYEDYTAGEIDKPEFISIKRAYDNGKVDGKQVHVLSYLGETWGMGAPRFTADKVVEWSLKVTAEGGAISWDIPVQANGLIPQSFIDQLTAVNNAVRKK